MTYYERFGQEAYKAILEAGTKECDNSGALSRRHLILRWDLSEDGLLYIGQCCRCARWVRAKVEYLQIAERWHGHQQND